MMKAWLNRLIQDMASQQLISIRLCSHSLCTPLNMELPCNQDTHSQALNQGTHSPVCSQVTHSQARSQATCSQARNQARQQLTRLSEIQAIYYSNIYINVI